MVNDLLSGHARHDHGGPFNVLLRSPEMGNRAQKLGEYLRFQNLVPRPLNEMAILMTARMVVVPIRMARAQTARHSRRASTRAVVEICRPAAAGAHETRRDGDLQLLTELREHRRVSDATYKAQ
jgi:4-carboxymuconolactone decarboxylase